ncbi:hypothetical protein FLONG3_3506 [Fusarium longipes]|uniref:F-box domain-containing protein n=1 Tax=Fusarium longipes TaxID=694270 RepID=A0A395T118_9HYPO|nr:hypothetical protein FLONG3_3506 [Fusarium longipes]
MPSISSLPPEVTVAILQHLNPFDILSILWTFNKALYGAAKIAFKPYKEWARNTKRMTILFPPQSTHSSRRLCPSYPSHIPPFSEDIISLREEIPRKEYNELSLNAKCGPYIRCSPPDLITWINLDGTFEWLKPLDEEMAETRAVASKTEVDALLKKASELGLIVPPGFEAFVRSDKLHHRFPRTWFFNLSKLIKCPASIDDGQGGYLCRFHSEEQLCAFAYLYLSPDGHHCVLVSQVDIYETFDEDNSDTDEFEKADFFIAGLSFEEYLVTVYFEGLLRLRAEPFQGLVHFVKHVYRSPAEVEHLRDSNEAIKVFLDAQKWKGTDHYYQQISG